MSHSNNNNNSNDYYDDDDDEEMSYDNFSDEVFSDLEDQGDDDDLPHAEYKAKGNEAYQKKDYRQAISLYSSAIETAICDNEEEEENNNNNNVEKSVLASYYSNRAASHLQILQYQEALDDCQKAIQEDPTFVKAYFRQAKVFTILGRLPEALKAYSMGLVHDPNHATAIKDRQHVETLQKRFALACELLLNNKKKKTNQQARQALLQIDAVLKDCPMWREALLKRLDCLVRLATPTRTQEAYALSTKLMRLGMPSSALNDELILLRSKCLFQQGALDDAMKHLRQVLSGDPDNKAAMTFLKQIRNLKKTKEQADTHYRSKQFKEAIEQYTAAIIELCPDDIVSVRSKLYFNRAACHNGLRQHDECIADCTSAIDLDKDYTKAYHRRAASNLLVGGKAACQSAVNDYEHLLQQCGEDEERDLREKLRTAKIQLKRANQRDLYKILGVGRDATEAEIKKRYRKAALQHHPDRQSNKSEKEQQEAAEKFRDINAAHEILSDPQKRRRYDQGVDEQDLDDPHARPGGGGGHHGHHGGG
eukprot:CAMPEP_0194203662 /NCGR_PEP_ID=MMETSP0156-20130528/3378_1 /TAXON_ID=33649 /ORGANISM="Thalassionema nitzschioides, Strain L26-B" /LENGTH=534 /DNA_ID=CAMNT_0038929453 /DNA_START=54 /DNA_END=1655 /DNA_ORIENTATION=+